MEKQKLCIDCKYHSIVTDVEEGQDNHMCNHPQAANPVDGSADLCHFQRFDSSNSYSQTCGKCGLIGKLFEPKD